MRLSAGSDYGMSLVELITVLAITTIISGIVFGGFSNYRATTQGDADMRLVEWQLKLGRETAINQRRAIEVHFTNPNLITLVRDEIPNGQTTISTVYLEHNTKFMQFAGEPDSPDAFGNAAPVSFSGAVTVMFTADGMLTDQLGNPTNGSVFLGQGAQPLSARVLTVFGATARIRSYRWNGTAWRP